MRFAELVSHRIFERKWRSREILRARLFEGPFIRLNLGFVYELWHFVAYYLLCGTRQTSQCWVDRLILLSGSMLSSVGLFVGKVAT